MDISKQPQDSTASDEDKKEIQAFLQKYQLHQLLSAMSDESDTVHLLADKSKKRAQDANFRKQKDTMIKKAERMRQNFDADIYILIRRKGRLYGYCGKTDSEPHTKWPLSEDEIVFRPPL
jgi:hypothetical protein